MPPREPRLRDQDGAEIDMTTGERKSTVVRVRADRLFPQLPAVVTGLEVKHGPVDDYGGCITLDMPAPDPIGPVIPHEGDGWFNPETEEYRLYRADLQMWVSVAEYVMEASPIAVVPLSGTPKCARYPALPCPHDCEFGISGPCILDAEDV